MRDALAPAKLPPTLKTLILHTLEEKVSEVELIETVTCINALRNNEFEAGIARKECLTQVRTSRPRTSRSPSTSESTSATISSKKSCAIFSNLPFNSWSRQRIWPPKWVRALTAQNPTNRAAAAANRKISNPRESRD